MNKIDKNFNIDEYIASNLEWFDVKKLKDYVKGLYWFDSNSSFSRLEDSLDIRENLKLLSQMPSGAYIEFETDSSEIALDVVLQASYQMPHMTTIGQAGFDLYIKSKEKFVYLSSTKTKETKYRVSLLKSEKSELKTYRIYLPLYTKVESLSLGLVTNAIIRAVSDNNPYIVSYGTSITQGGCASRPGMSYTSILGRNSDYRLLNFGFSGNAYLDKNIALAIVKINPKYVIIEAAANCFGRSSFGEDLEEFLKIVSINSCVLVLSHFPNSKGLVDIGYSKKSKDNTEIIKKTIKKLNKENIHYLDGYRILKKMCFEETVDGVHLTDLGFYFLAFKLREVIKKINVG